MWMPKVPKHAALPPGIVPATTFSSYSQNRANPNPDTSRMGEFRPGFALQSSKTGCCFIASDSGVVWVGGGQLQRSEKQYCRVTGKTTFPRRDVHAIDSLSWKIFSVDVVRVKFKSVAPKYTFWACLRLVLAVPCSFWVQSGRWHAEWETLREMVQSRKISALWFL